MGRKAICLFVLMIGHVMGQFANSWINYGNKYLKFPIESDGIYRIDYNTLSAGMSAVGVSISNVDPQKIKIYARGAEIFVYFYDSDGNGVFSPGDFLEFYGEKNDGKIDSALYLITSFQLNPYYSLVSDTIFYFLTWDNSTDGLRYTNFADTNFSNYTEAPFVLVEKILSFSDNYFSGDNYSFPYDNSPIYDRGEGWTSQPFGYMGVRNYSLDLVGLCTTGCPPIIFKTAICGYGDDKYIYGPDHRIKIKAGGSYTVIYDTAWDGQRTVFINKQFYIPTVGSNPLQFVFDTLPNQPSGVCQMGIGYIYYKYACKDDAGYVMPFKFEVPGGFGSVYVKLKNVVNPDTVVYDIKNGKRIRAVYDGQYLKAVIPGQGTQDRIIVAYTKNGVNYVSQLYPCGGGGYFTDYLSIGATLDSARIIITHPVFWQQATQYALYKEGLWPGNNVLLCDITQLYDQFSYGVYGHPLAIKNFITAGYLSWPKKIASVLLIGKGFGQQQTRKKVNNPYLQWNFVPAWGNPPSDIPFTTIYRDSILPRVPIGRLAVMQPQELLNYLQKLQEYIAAQQSPYIPLENKEWMKHIIHLGGGLNPAENNLFKSFLSMYESIIKNPYYGGIVDTVYKTSTDPIQIVNIQYIKDRINNGVSLMTFFGHTAYNSFDIMVDYPENFNNTGRYHFVFSNGCFVGNIYDIGGSPNLIDRSMSERYVLTADKGAIGFLAEVSLGFAYSLHQFAEEWYKQLSYKNYNKSIGYVTLATLDTLLKPYNSSNFLPYLNNIDINLFKTCFEKSLHGDPDIVLNTHALPDYAITSQKVWTDPPLTQINTALDSFTLNVLVYNIGKAIDTNVMFMVKRIPPTGNTQIYMLNIGSVYSMETVSVKLPVSFLDAGFNSLILWVDPDLIIQEMQENNNYILNYEFFISSDELIPIWPYNYMVLPDTPITLKANTLDIFAPSREYVFQIDTTDLFNSPKFVEAHIISPGGVVEWTPPPGYFNMPDSTVFFWRVSPYYQDTSKLKWKKSSFQIIRYKLGWGQSHFFQFTDNKFIGIEANRQTRQFNFAPVSYNLKVSVKPKFGLGNQVLVNGELVEYGICGYSPSLHVYIFDSLTFKAWGTHYIDGLGNNYNPDNSFGNANDLGACRPRVEYYFIFRVQNIAQMDSLASLLTNKIPDGNFILVHSAEGGLFKDTNYWKEYHYQAFEQLGALNIRNVPNYNPYIFFVKKGQPASAKEIIGQDSLNTLTWDTTITLSRPAGEIHTPLIGPAHRWLYFFWKYHSIPQNSQDTMIIDIYGVRKDGTSSKRLTIKPPTFTYFNLENAIPSDSFPYIKITLNTLDTTFFTPGQMDYWYILYNPAPELALNPKKGFFFHSSSLYQGEPLKVAIAKENVSSFYFDTIRTLYEYSSISSILKEKKLQPFSFYIDTFVGTTAYSPGINYLKIEANPKDSLWQYEQFHFNNIAYIPFEVIKDKRNPIIDVTFDGMHISNGEIVSPNPLIEIKIKDENIYMPLNDTSLFTLKLKTPNNDTSRIYFTSPDGKTILKFIPPSTTKENVAKIIWHPFFSKNGEYTLFVQAKDKSGNLAGTLEYSISFNIVLESGISYIYPFPNPFSTSTRFVFVITGTKIPDEFSIKIYTISGKLIKELTTDELGPLRLGKNITNPWFAIDNYGAPLANGIYFYVVNAKYQGTNLPIKIISPSENPSAFKHNIGKLYIMR